MADFLGKKYKLVKSDKFDEYLSELNVSFVLRQVAKTLSPSVEVTCDGDQWTLKTSSTFKTSEIRFKLGEPFEEERMDGAKVQSTVTIDGNKMTHVMKGDPESTIVREFNGADMKAIMTVNNVVCTREYKAE